MKPNCSFRAVLCATMFGCLGGYSVLAEPNADADKKTKDKKPSEKVVVLPAKPVDRARWTASAKGPATVQKEKRTLTIELPAKYAAFTFGGGGRYLIFRFDALNTIGIMDLQTAKIVREIRGISEGDLIAANATHVFVVMPAKMLIQRWSLKNLERDRIVRIQGGQTPRAAVTGAAGVGPLLLIGRKGKLFDPDTLKPKTIKGDGVIGGIGEYGFAVCASANGLVFGGIPTGYGAVPHSLMKIHGDQTVVHKLGGTSNAIRWSQPTADGHVVFTPNSGIYDALGRKVTAKWLGNRLIVPTMDPRYFITVRYADKNSKAVLEVCTTGDRRIIYSESGFKELVPRRINSWHDIVGSTKMGREPRVQWLVKPKILVTLPNSNDRVTLRPWDVMSRLKKTGEEYHWLDSLPPYSITEGDRLKYQVRVVSKLGKLKFRLEEGPKGMSISAKGQVQWDVPESFEGDTAPVIVTVTDAGGNELIHSFDVKVTRETRIVPSGNKSAATGESQGTHVAAAKPKSPAVAKKPRTATDSTAGHEAQTDSSKKKLPLKTIEGVWRVTMTALPRGGSDIEDVIVISNDVFRSRYFTARGYEPGTITAKPTDRGAYYVSADCSDRRGGFVRFDGTLDPAGKGTLSVSRHIPGSGASSYHVRVTGFQGGGQRSGDLGKEVVAWVAKNNAFHAKHAIVADVNKKIAPLVRSGTGFQWRLGPDLVKSGKATVLAVHSGRFFVLELTPEQAKRLTLVGRTAMFVSGTKSAFVHAPKFHLANLKTEGETTGAGGSIRGTLDVTKPKSAGKANYALRLTYSDGQTTHQHFQRLGSWLTKTNYAFAFSHSLTGKSPQTIVGYVELGDFIARNSFVPISKPIPVVLTVEPNPG